VLLQLQIDGRAQGRDPYLDKQHWVAFSDIGPVELKPYPERWTYYGATQREAHLAS